MNAAAIGDARDPGELAHRHRPRPRRRRSVPSAPPTPRRCSTVRSSSAASASGAPRMPTVAFLDAPSHRRRSTRAGFVHVVAAITDQAVAIFGGAPYRRYTFLFLDDAGLALEHVNSLVLGVSSANLARDTRVLRRRDRARVLPYVEPDPPAPRGAPRPAHRRDAARPTISGGAKGSRSTSATRSSCAPDCTPPGRRARRASPPASRATSRTRATRTSPPQRASLTAGLPPGVNGDYSGDYYLSGQLIGDMLELIIRDSTDGRARDGRRDDDPLPALRRRPRLHLRRHRTRRELRLRLRPAACSSPSTSRRAAAYRLRRARCARSAIAWSLTWEGAHDSAGAPLPDTRVYVMRPDSAPPDSPLRIAIIRPTGAWAAAGLHSGDELLAIDGRPSRRSPNSAACSPPSRWAST